jgi:amino acid permease
MSQYQRLESLRFLSVAGVVGTVLATFSVIYALFHDGTADDMKGASVLETFQSTIRPNGGIVDMIGAVSTVTFSLCNQFNVPQVIEGLKTKDAVSVRKVAFGAASIPALLYVVTAVAGYLHSGKRTRENVFGNFAALIEARNIVINLGVVSVVLSIAVCHILNNFPLRSSAEMDQLSLGPAWYPFPLSCINYSYRSFLLEAFNASRSDRCANR